MNGRNIGIYILLFLICLGLALGINYAIKNDLINKYLLSKGIKEYVIYNNDEIDFKDYISKNKNTILYFESSWCPACKINAKELNKFMKKNPDIPVIVISYDKKIEDLKTYLDENNYNWFVIMDSDKKIRDNYFEDVKSIPCYYLVDKDLNILKKGDENTNIYEFYF